MRIAISARGMSIVAGGAKEYIRNLIKFLPEVDSKNDYYIYYSDKSQCIQSDLPNVHSKVLPRWPNIIWDHFILPVQLRRDNIDVAMFPKCITPLFCQCRMVISILDLGYFFPGLRAHRYLDTIYMKLMIPRSIRKADGVIAISRHTHSDIMRMIPNVAEDRIHTIYLASALVSSNKEDDDKLFDLQKPYIFLSSSISPRKNIERTLLALASIKDQIPHQIVITGGKQWGSSRLQEIITEHDMNDRFVQLGFVEMDRLKELYSNADIYLMPSLYEGFSLTLLEAMECGCPVVASNVASHPEVVGDAAVMFDPYSVEDMARAILRVATDTGFKEELRARGYEQAKKFSWERCARETAAVLHQVGAAQAD